MISVRINDRREADRKDCRVGIRIVIETKIEYVSA